MPKKKMSDMVFIRVSPPDYKKDLTAHDLSEVLVRRLGLKRKESRAQHSKLLLELMKYRKENVPLDVEQLSNILGVSQSQAYEEIRKWRTLGLVEFVKIPSGTSYIKGYMLTAQTVNRLLDKVESATKSFMRKTRRIAKDFDDLLMLDVARQGKTITEEPGNDEEPSEEDDEQEDPRDDEEPKENLEEDTEENEEKIISE